MSRQLQDPIIIMTSNLPSWLKDVASVCPFLFPFETRQVNSLDVIDIWLLQIQKALIFYISNVATIFHFVAAILCNIL